MLFTSYDFLIFIGALFLVYYMVPGRFQWMLLLAAGYLFYFLAGPEYLKYIIFTTATTYLISLKLTALKRTRVEYLKAHKAELSRDGRKAYKNAMKKRRFGWLLVCLFLNIGLLAVLKYTNFTIANINGVLKLAGSGRQLDFLDMALPLGISFYTFQTMGYIIDVYREKYEAQKNPLKLALFVSFFPQLVQGPISRYDDLAQTLYEEHPFSWRQFTFGLQRMVWGFFKKLVIADRILTAVNTLIHNPQDYQGAYVFAGMLFYALELYADFTGGIDITIGAAQALGIRVTENFRRPYFSKSIKEYWRRWHITMGTWFTDYLFYPISVCQPMLKFSKFARSRFGEALGKRLPVYVSSFTVWFATGIWHGASWNFIVWGLANWALIMVSQELEPAYRRFHHSFPVEGSLWFKVFQVARTILLMSCLRMFDCYRDVPLTLKMFSTMFTVRNWRILWDGSLLGLGIGSVDYGILLAGLAVVFLVSMAQRSGGVRERIARRPAAVRFAVWYGLFLAVLLWGAYGIGYDASQFIYNQF